jgi:hypothetical protein
MLCFELPTDRVEYLQLAFPAAGPGLVARWGTQSTPFTVAAWDDPGRPPGWQLTDHPLHLSPDGEWVSVFDQGAGEVRITRVGAPGPAATVGRDRGADNVWTAVAPGGVAVAWKDDPLTVVRALPGGRWLTEKGERVFRVADEVHLQLQPDRRHLARRAAGVPRG